MAKQPKRPKPKSKLECHLDIYWPTNDDWCPNYERDTVRVRVTTLLDGSLRVSVWGADDLGMERDIQNPSHETVQQQIKWVKTQLPNPLSQAWLRAQGFVRA
jgi:hypothetical protein